MIYFRIVKLILMMGLTNLSQAQVVYHLKSAPKLSVGDIVFEEKFDNVAFRLCNENEIFQYYSLDILNMEKFNIYARKKLKKINTNYSGYITFRFIINCKGETDRFRVLCVDSKYCPQSCNYILIKHLLNIIKGYKSWKLAELEGQPVDYYQIFSFKIYNSSITNVLP